MRTIGALLSFCALIVAATMAWRSAEPAVARAWKTLGALALVEWAMWLLDELEHQRVRGTRR